MQGSKSPNSVHLSLLNINVLIPVRLDQILTYSEMVKETWDIPDLILSDMLYVFVLHTAPAHQKNDKMGLSFQYLK